MRNKTIKNTWMMRLLVLTAISMTGASCALSVDKAHKAGTTRTGSAATRIMYPKKNIVGEFTCIRVDSVKHNFVRAFKGPESDAVVIGEIQTCNGRDPSKLRFEVTDAGHMRMKVEEIMSTDTHSYAEKAAAFMFESGWIRDVDGEFIGYAFNVADVSQPNRNQWHTYTLTKRPRWPGLFTKPVVFSNVKTSNDSDPCYIRIRNAEGSTDSTYFSFEYKIEEWSCDDGNHNAEDLSFAVFEKGVYDVGADADGNETSYDHYILKVYCYGFGGSLFDYWTTIPFQTDYASLPIVISRVHTYFDTSSYPFITRIDHVNQNDDSFSMSWQNEPDVNDDDHRGEQIGYLVFGAVN